MLTNILSRVVANPWVYDQVQMLAGAGQVRSRLAGLVASLPMVSTVLDLGGGTGLYRNLLPRTCSYVCLDIEMAKLQGFLGKETSRGTALLADASRVPLRTDSVDVVLCTFVTHHIPDAVLAQMIDESARVLKSTGRLLLVDCVWAPSRWLGRLLWKFDGGRYPRTAETLRSLLSRRYKMELWESFSVYHEYVLCAAIKQHREDAASICRTTLGN